MLFLKMDSVTLSALKTFLIFLNYLPQGWYNEIPLDKTIIDKLRNL
jgi:hypothetical protein